jgi:hypothetical protein
MLELPVILKEQVQSSEVIETGASNLGKFEF